MLYYRDNKLCIKNVKMEPRLLYLVPKFMDIYFKIFYILAIQLNMDKENNFSVGHLFNQAALTLT